MLRQNTVNAKEMSRSLGISEELAYIMGNRDIRTVEEGRRFLNASINDLYAPELMKDMDKGTDIIIDSVNTQKNIVVYGDYDADGVSSTVILFKALKRCGANVNYYIPDRESEGYGMNSDRIRLLKEEGCQVILTCDNGIAAYEQVKLAKESGMTVVLTNHHDIPYISAENEHIEYIIPEADAVINPKQKNCSYPFKLLCGAGIAFKFVQRIYEKLGMNKKELEDYIEIAAIGTICDVVDLLDENRIIARYGLFLMNRSKNTGLKALIKENGLEGRKLNSYHVGFIMGPCINATGRLDTAALSVELLLCEEEERAAELAKRLKELNTERQNMTVNSVEEISSCIEGSCIKNDRVFVIYNKNVHESIAGIVAGKIKDKYYVPSIVLTKGKNMVKGSGRSIENYNMFEELTGCKELLDKFGGHPMAAGLSLKCENIDLLREKLNKNCKLTEDELTPKIRIDEQLCLKRLNFNLIDELEVLEPFGKGNPSPVFAVKNILVNRIFIIGKDKNIFKLYCGEKGCSKKFEAICFDGIEKLKDILVNKYGEEVYRKIEFSVPENLYMDMIYVPGINDYNGMKNIQLTLKDFRISS